MKTTETPEPWNISDLIPYSDWIIWGWTGWKGEKFKAHTSDFPYGCAICGHDFIEGDAIAVLQATPPTHWTCRYPDNRRDTLHAQWLAVRDETFLYAECGIHHDLDQLPAGIYQKHEAFAIINGAAEMTEDSPPEMLEAAKLIGLARLKKFIDDMERR